MRKVTKKYTRASTITEKQFQTVHLLNKNKLDVKLIAEIIQISKVSVMRVIHFSSWEAYCQNKLEYAKHQKELKAKRQGETKPVSEAEIVKPEISEANGVDKNYLETAKIYQVLVSIEAKISKLLLLEERKVAYRQEMAEKKKKIFGWGQ